FTASCGALTVPASLVATSIVPSLVLTEPTITRSSDKVRCNGCDETRLVTASNGTVTSPANSVLISSFFPSGSSFTIVPVNRSPFFSVTWSAQVTGVSTTNQRRDNPSVRNIIVLLAESFF